MVTKAERARQYYLANKELIRAKNKKYYEEHKEEQKAKKKLWYQATYLEKQKLSDTARRSKLKEEYSKIILPLKNAPCSDCGETFPPVAMDFDHVRGEKKFNVSEAVWGRYNLENVLEEINKCELVCANCHVLRTISRRKPRQTKRPGIEKMYQLVQEAKSVPCIKCKRKFAWQSMEFDHVRGEKKFAISAGMGKVALKALIEEIEKCDVICANCHRVTTQERLQK